MYRVCLFLKTIDSMDISAYIIVIIQIITYLHTIIVLSTLSKFLIVLQWFNFKNEYKFFPKQNKKTYFHNYLQST